MGIVVSSKEELEWIATEHRRQKFYMIITVMSFGLMIYALFNCLIPKNILTPIYMLTFFYAFLAFMVTALVLTKSQRYLRIIDDLLDERR